MRIRGRKNRPTGAEGFPFSRAGACRSTSAGVMRRAVIPFARRTPCTQRATAARAML